MDKLRILLIEDDEMHCQQYAEYVKTKSDRYILQTANGCKSGLLLLKRFKPNIILLDLELNGGDGNGLDFLTESREKQLPNRPCVVIITNNIANRIHNRARHLGADFIFEKSKPDYSPETVISFTCQHLLGQDLSLQPNVMDEKSTKAAIARVLESMGINAGMSGKIYLIEAIYIAVEKTTVDLRHDIYVPLARAHQKSEQTIEKCIRNVIMKAWNTTEYSILAKYYTAQINPGTGYPSNKEFIAEMAEKLRV